MVFFCSEFPDNLEKSRLGKKTNSKTIVKRKVSTREKKNSMTIAKRYDLQANAITNEFVLKRSVLRCDLQHSHAK